MEKTERLFDYWKSGCGVRIKLRGKLKEIVYKYIKLMFKFV